eukprot:scaffold2519_cov108-Isochrysis_galbana.AAC.8
MDGQHWGQTPMAPPATTHRLNESIASPTPDLPTRSTGEPHATARSADEHPTIEPTDGLALGHQVRAVGWDAPTCIGHSCLIQTCASESAVEDDRPNVQEIDASSLAKARGERRGHALRRRLHVRKLARLVAGLEKGPEEPKRNRRLACVGFVASDEQATPHPVRLPIGARQPKNCRRRLRALHARSTPQN